MRNINMSFTEGRKDNDNAESYLNVVRAVIEEARRRGVNVNIIDNTVDFENVEYSQNKEVFAALPRIPRRCHCAIKFKDAQISDDTDAGKEYNKLYDDYQKLETENYHNAAALKVIREEMYKLNEALHGMCDGMSQSALINQAGLSLMAAQKINKTLEDLER